MHQTSPLPVSAVSAGLRAIFHNELRTRFPNGACSGSRGLMHQPPVARYRMGDVEEIGRAAELTTTPWRGTRRSAKQNRENTHTSRILPVPLYSRDSDAPQS
jgi:hypothetical protein